MNLTIILSTIIAILSIAVSALFKSNKKNRKKVEDAFQQLQKANEVFNHAEHAKINQDRIKEEKHETIKEVKKTAENKKKKDIELDSDIHNLATDFYDKLSNKDSSSKDKPRSI